MLTASVSIRIPFPAQIKRKNKLPFFTIDHSVYILYSHSLDRFYKGQSANLADRINRHNMGYEKSTQNGIPWILIWSIVKPNRSSAIMLERKLKNLSKKRLIEFIMRHSEGVEGPDEFLLLEKLSGC